MSCHMILLLLLLCIYCHLLLNLWFKSSGMATVSAGRVQSQPILSGAPSMLISVLCLQSILIYSNRTVKTIKAVRFAACNRVVVIAF